MYTVDILHNKLNVKLFYCKKIDTLTTNVGNTTVKQKYVTAYFKNKTARHYKMFSCIFVFVFLISVV